MERVKFFLNLEYFFVVIEGSWNIVSYLMKISHPMKHSSYKFFFEYSPVNY
jgi:hypothetical protein